MRGGTQHLLTSADPLFPGAADHERLLKRLKWSHRGLLSAGRPLHPPDAPASQLRHFTALVPGGAASAINSADGPRSTNRIAGPTHAHAPESGSPAHLVQESGRLRLSPRTQTADAAIRGCQTLAAGERPDPLLQTSGGTVSKSHQRMSLGR